MLDLKSKVVLFLVWAAIGVCAGTPGDKTINVWVSIPPQAFLAERIGGNELSIQVLLPGGQEPHRFRPSPRQLSELVKADLFFTIGMPFEKIVLEKIRGAGVRVQNSDSVEGIPRRRMDGHRHGEEPHIHDHAHESGEDPHVWLSPKNALAIAENMCDALVQKLGDRGGVFEKNLAAFRGEIERLDGEIGQILEPCHGRAFYVFHPAYGYFSDAYHLEQMAVEVEGKSPTPKDLASLIHRAKAQDIRVIFVQPQFDARSARSLAAAIHGVVEVLDPLAYDVPTNLRQMAVAIRKSMDADFGLK